MQCKVALVAYEKEGFLYIVVLPYCVYLTC